MKEFVGLEEVAKLNFLVVLFAEALGTFLLVLIGTASCITWVAETPPTVLHIAFTFGLAVASLAQVSVLPLQLLRRLVGTVVREKLLAVFSARSFSYTMYDRVYIKKDRGGREGNFFSKFKVPETRLEHFDATLPPL